MSQRPVFLILAGTLTFGLLTFAAGLLVGLGLQPGADQGTPFSGGPALPGSTGPGAGAAPPTGTPPVPAASPAPAPAQPAPADPAPSVAAPGPAAAPVPPPAGPPVKGLRSGSVGVGEAGPLVQALAAADPEAVAEPAPDRVVSVEVGRFLLMENAAAFAMELSGQGYAADILLAAFPDMPPWHVVTLGEQPDEKTAISLAQAVSRRTGLEARVVSWPRPAS